ncbi:MAG TPA: aryl-sulfate sulfotransferase [Thermopetrobacter sp.]|nr:aryl-sulfate sulfotransferase [Thermopetrobacter sp.]
MKRPHPPRKRSVVIAGHPTSISLEDEFWDELCRIAADQDRSLSSLLAEIDETRGARSLSSAVRVYVLKWLKARGDDTRPPWS